MEYFKGMSPMNEDNEGFRILYTNYRQQSNDHHHDNSTEPSVTPCTDTIHVSNNNEVTLEANKQLEIKANKIQDNSRSSSLEILKPITDNKANEVNMDAAKTSSIEIISNPIDNEISSETTQNEQINRPRIRRKRKRKTHNHGIDYDMENDSDWVPSQPTRKKAKKVKKSTRKISKMEMDDTETDIMFVIYMYANLKSIVLKNKIDKVILIGYQVKIK